ncbi:MAG: 2-succinyl-5-enolpyruvyl-6-hydroxy-3-cyclohexene-1-carboxylate synthase [Treponema sp. CETP13]|nr:MAG: 2-succinyl-5-enolpyruvyl-6-hydroxy-3-cyclohexene-1-carboxylate synthase [Treponema sp. CETP13]
MGHYYTNEKNIQILIALLKKHGIRKVIASPGTTNMTFVGSIQYDPYFEIYSCVDERSAAYMACGLAAETGGPVVLTCTGATASRNYLPGLTEAFYRKLPLLAVTSTQIISKIGHNIAQVIDRSSTPKDVVKLSVTLPVVNDDDDFWDCEIKANKAILELKHYGGGPVHINLPTRYDKNFETKELPSVRFIDRITQSDKFPELPKGRIAIFIGSHCKMTKEQTLIIDEFCSAHNAVVFCDHTSGYKGKYRVMFSLATYQQGSPISRFVPDLLIHIGEISGDNTGYIINSKKIWRISEDGEIRDTYRKLQYIFEMPEEVFFKHFLMNVTQGDDSYLENCKKHLCQLNNKIPKLPFSNIWIAAQMANKLPENSVIHFGILNTLRSWNFFEIPHSVMSYSNVGGFGIDGDISALIGASLANKKKLYFGIVGDLAFFYDMNAIGNRQVCNNLRILLINNGKGVEFKNFNHPVAAFGKDADNFMAAAGHFGNKSQNLIKHYSQDLGFEYLCAKNKEEFEKIYRHFLMPEITDVPMLFEVFTNDYDESNALKLMMNLEQTLEGKTKTVVKQIIGDNGVKMIKKIIKNN